MPCGIFGTNSTMRIFAIPGSMPLLISVGQLAERGAHMDVRANVHSFTALSVWEVPLPRSDGSYFLIDLRDLGPLPSKDPLFTEFFQRDVVSLALLSEETPEPPTLPTAEDNGYINTVQEAMATGTWRAALPTRDRRMICSNLVCMEAALTALRADDGSTFCWEVFAGAARTTLTVLRGGHVAGAPVDIRAHVDLRDHLVRRHFVHLTLHFRPCHNSRFYN